jgi:hypothetical protein
MLDMLGLAAMLLDFLSDAKSHGLTIVVTFLPAPSFLVANAGWHDRFERDRHGCKRKKGKKRKSGRK